MIDIPSVIVNLFVLIFSGSAVVCVAYLLFSRLFNVRMIQSKLLDLKKAHHKQVLPLRLQAYERLVIFLERINPAALLVRLYSPELTVSQYRQLLIKEINAEYQHNVTQQLYVSDRAWSSVKKIREETLHIIQSLSKDLQDDEACIVLSKAVLENLSAMEENPYELAIAILKTELQEII